MLPVIESSKYCDPVSIRDFFMYNVNTSRTPAPTIIITGRPGPTGKTWLREELRAMGYNAIEISEALYQFVGYIDEKNHVTTRGLDNVVLIVLNKRLEGM